jgi:hypothetical protein
MNGVELILIPQRITFIKIGGSNESRKNHLGGVENERENSFAYNNLE